MKLGIVSLIVSLVALGVIVWHWLWPQTSGDVYFVRMPIIMEKYQGAIDASVRLRMKQDAIQMNIDSIMSSMPSTVTSESEQQQRARLESYVREVQKKDQADREAISRQILSQIRTSAEAVASQRGAAIVLTITDDGMILYNDSATDITEDVLSDLKKSYRDEMRK